MGLKGSNIQFEDRIITHIKTNTMHSNEHVGYTKIIKIVPAILGYYFDTCFIIDSLCSVPPHFVLAAL